MRTFPTLRSRSRFPPTMRATAALASCGCSIVRDFGHSKVHDRPRPKPNTRRITHRHERRGTKPNLDYPLLLMQHCFARGACLSPRCSPRRRCGQYHTDVQKILQRFMPLGWSAGVVQRDHYRSSRTPKFLKDGLGTPFRKKDIKRLLQAIVLTHEFHQFLPIFAFGTRPTSICFCWVIF